MHTYIQPLAREFEKHADATKAAGAAAYMRNQFLFYGLPTPLRRQLCKTHMKQALPAYRELPVIVKELWRLPQREYQYFATELVAAFKNIWTIPLTGLTEYMITHKSWWDTVDHITSEITGPYFKRFPEQIAAVTGAWNASADFWLQRSSIMFQKSYKKNTDTRLLAEYILRCAGSREFFIQKAIGWALREYSKTDPRWVKQFVQQHQLPALSVREALKRMH